MTYELTLLNPGTIASIASFPTSTRRPSRAKRVEYTNQCIHSSYEELSEGIAEVRCHNLVVVGRHGFLCAEHGTDQHTSKTKVRKSQHTTDREIVESILAYESRALRNAQREVVRVGAKTQITYCM